MESRGNKNSTYLFVPRSRFLFLGLSARVPGCQKLQMRAQLGLTQDALQLYLYGNSGHQRVKLSSVNNDADGCVGCRDSDQLTLYQLFNHGNQLLDHELGFKTPRACYQPLSGQYNISLCHSLLFFCGVN